MNEELPSGLRLGCAILSAILAPLVAVALLLGGPLGFVVTLPFVFIFGAPIAAAHVLALWLPAWAWASRHGALGWSQSAALGFVCGSLPVFALSGGDAYGTALFGGSGVIGAVAFRATLSWQRT